MKKSGGGRADEDEVEEMLRAAEDEALLKLSVDAHLPSHHSPSAYLHPNLQRRFQALKFKSPSNSSSSSSSSSSSAKPSKPIILNPPPNPITTNQTLAVDDDDDLFKRFAALKASIAPPTPDPQGPQQQHPITSDHKLDQDDEDEVAKLIQWAMDAARLHPSSSSSATDDDDDDEDDDSESESDGYEGR